MNKLIAISGTKGSGKDCAANMFQYCLSVPKIFRQYGMYSKFGKLFPKKGRKLAFADQLKSSLSEILCIPVQKLNDRDFKENYYLNIQTLEISDSDNTSYPKLTDGKFNKLIKDLDPSIINYSLSIRQVMQGYGTQLCQRLFGKNVGINSTLNKISKNTIISDLRFISEENAVHNKFGIIIFIKRPNVKFGNHASEKEMQDMLKNDKFDIIIENDGTKEDLFNHIKLCCNDIKRYYNTINRRKIN